MAKNKITPSSPLAALHRLEFILQHGSDQLLRSQLAIGFGQLRIIEGLHADKACSQRSLAHSLRQTEANVSRQLRILKQKGMVEIAKHPKDGRQRLVKLTSHGQTLRTRADTALTDFEKTLLAKVDFRDAVNFTETADKLARLLA